MAARIPKAEPTRQRHPRDGESHGFAASGELRPPAVRSAA
jgi:hypothetical protein